MTAPKKLLREAAKAALLNKTIAQDRVDASRPNPLTDKAQPGEGASDYPAICIYIPRCRSEVFDESPRRYLNKAELTVECAIAIEDNGVSVDDQLEEFEAAVVDALLADDTLGGTVDDLQLNDSTNTVDGTAARLLGAVIITFEAEFYTTHPAEGTYALDDLQTVHTEHSLGGLQGDARDRAKTHTTGLDQ
jgi:hypothetical protein